MSKKCKNYIVKFAKSETPDNWHRSFLGLVLGIIIMMMVVLISGCSQNCSNNYREIVYFEPYPVVSPKLLLRSQREESVDPQIFAYRSDWPSTTGEIELGRTTFYRQYWYNRQSLSPNVRDTSFSLFEGYRYGTTVR